MRRNYVKVHILIDLINMLRRYPMSKAEIKQFLIEGFNSQDVLRRGSDTISDKTVNRWIEDLEGIYPDNFYKTGDKYEMDLDNFPAKIDEKELQALHTAMQSVANDESVTKLLRGLESKLWGRFQETIKHQKPKPTEYHRDINNADTLISSEIRVIGPRARFEIDNGIKNMLDNAILHSNLVNIKYYGKPQTVRPLGVFYGDNNVYLLATKEENGEPESQPRNYKLSGITDVVNTRNKFPRDPSFSFEEYINRMFGVFNDHTMYDVEWHINKSVVNEAKRYIFHPSQGDFIDNPDGSATIKFRCGGLDAMCAYLFQWNGDIVPVAPTELVAKYRQRLERVLGGLPKK